MPRPRPAIRASGARGHDGRRRRGTERPAGPGACGRRRLLGALRGEAGRVARPATPARVAARRRPAAVDARVLTTWKLPGPGADPCPARASRRLSPASPPATRPGPGPEPRARAGRRSARGRGGGPRPSGRGCPRWSRRRRSRRSSRASRRTWRRRPEGRGPAASRSWPAVRPSAPGSSGFLKVDPKVLIPDGWASRRLARISASVALIAAASPVGKLERGPRDDLARFQVRAPVREAELVRAPALGAVRRADGHPLEHARRAPRRMRWRSSAPPRRRCPGMLIPNSSPPRPQEAAFAVAEGSRAPPPQTSRCPHARPGAGRRPASAPAPGSRRPRRGGSSPSRPPDRDLLLRRPAQQLDQLAPREPGGRRGRPARRSAPWSAAPAGSRARRRRGARSSPVGRDRSSASS